MPLSEAFCSTGLVHFYTAKRHNFTPQLTQSLQRGLESSMEAEWQANLPNQAVLLGGDDFREGLSAVKAQRQQVFIGK